MAEGSCTKLDSISRYTIDQFLLLVLLRVHKAGWGGKRNADLDLPLQRLGHSLLLLLAFCVRL